MRTLGNAFVCLVCLGLLVALMAGCAATRAPASGFLGDYSNFQPDPQDKSMLFYEKPGVDWARYTRLMIDPVVIYYNPEAKYRQIQPDELKKLTDCFRDTVIDEVQSSYPVVNEPSSDVLRIRAAITDLDPANPAVNVLSVAGMGIPVDMGGASIEAEFLDSLSNERLAALIDRKIGNPIDIRIHKGFTKWGYAEDAFKAWAKELHKELDAAQKQ